MSKNRRGDSASDDGRDHRPAPLPTTDLSAYQRDTERRLILGGVALLFLVGGGLVLLLYDLGALAGAWLCLGAMALPVAAVIGAVWLFDWLGRDRDHTDHHP